jgi:dienelactone hydrolase
MVGLLLAAVALSGCASDHGTASVSAFPAGPAGASSSSNSTTASVGPAPASAEPAVVPPATPIPEPAPALARLLPTAPGVHGFTLAVEGEPAAGLLAVPEGGTAGTLLVVVKGWAGTLDHVRPLLQEVRDAGMLAVAMDFRGPADAWKVDTAAEDTVAATLALRAEHPEVERVVLFGFSMGGAASGMALAAAPPGTFTHWVAGAGVMDLNATWREEPTLQPLIENVTGGKPIEVPSEYARRSPVMLVPAIASSGVQRIHLVHGAGDTIVPTSHQYLMYDALREAGAPTTAYTVVTGNGTWLCVLVVVCVPQPLPAGPAAHEVGYFGYMATVLWQALLGREEPQDPAIHYAVEGVTGARVRLPD